MVRIVSCTKTMLIVKTDLMARVGPSLTVLSVIGQTKMACMPVMRVVSVVEAQARARPVQRAQRPPRAATLKTTAWSTVRRTNTLDVSQTALGVQVLKILVSCTKTMLIVKTDLMARVGPSLTVLSVIGQTKMACMPVMRVVSVVEAQARARPVQRAQRPPRAATPRTTVCAARIPLCRQARRREV